MASKPVNIVVKGEYNDKDLKRAAADIKALQAASTTMGTRMQNVGSQMQDFGRSVSNVGKSMTVGVTLPIVGVGVAATKMAMDFDTSLTKMVSLVGLTRDEVDGMRGDIIAVASQYGKSAKEAADAMFFITSAGLRGSDAMETLEASLKGAAIGLGDVITIADLSTSAMNAYGSEVLDATTATSILRTAVEQGKLESSQLAGSMGSVLPVASAMGVKFGEVAGIMAAMSRTGTNAAEAATQVRGIMSQIAKETPKGAKALKSVGLSYEGIRRQIKEQGLLPALQTLVTAFDGNTVATSAFFGNIRALTGVMDLFGEMADSTAEVVGTVSRAVAEDLDPAMAAAAETTGFQLQQAFATMKNSLIEFGDIIAPFVAQLADKIKTLGQAFQSLSPETKELIVRGLAIAAAIGPVLLIVGKLITVIGGVIKVVGILVAAFNPVTLAVAAIVVGIGLLVAAFKLAWDSSATLRKAVGDLMATVQNIARVILGDLLAAFNRIIGRGTDLRGILDTVATVAGRVLTVAIQRLQGVFEFLGNVVRAGIKIFEVQVRLFRVIAGVITGVVVAAIDIFMNRLGPISFAVQRFVGGARAGFSALGSIAMAVFRNAGSAIELFVNKAISAINALITAYNLLAGILPGMSRITQLTEFRFKGLTAAADSAAGATWNAASATGANIREAERASASTAALTDGLGDLASGYGDVGKAADGAGKKKKESGEKAEEARKKLQKFKEAFTETANELKAKTKEIQDAYDGVIKSVQDVITGAFDTSNIDPNRIGENGEKVGGTWLDGLASQAEKAVKFADKVAKVVQLGLQPGSAAFETVMAVTKQQGEGLLDELIAGGVDKVNESIAIVDSVTGAALRIGTEAADKFFGTGLKLAKETEDAFTKRFGEGGPGYNKLNRLMNHLAKSMERTTTITVNTVHTSTGSPGGGRIIAGAAGGIVNRPTFALIGEAGPEAVIPLGRSRGNDPLPMTGRSGSLSMGTSTTINLTVNAGMGTQGAEVGRQIVDALKAYERRNGSVYVAA
jgi:TP901 family phage tail tape measure protein